MGFVSGETEQKLGISIGNGNQLKRLQRQERHCSIVAVMNDVKANETGAAA